MFSTEDTIVAIATPAGRGGIGVVRISGPDAQAIVSRLAVRRDRFEPRHATFARLDVDQVVITVFPAPHSYTGEDVAEISAHGSPVVLDAILRRAMVAGARLAAPGEFTLRAFLNGKVDLIQAEAVGDLVDAVTPLQARAAFDQLEGTLTAAIGVIETALFELIAKLEASLDFPDEGYHFIRPEEVHAGIVSVTAQIDDLLRGAARGRLVREGAQVVIVGAPNVGKSSLFNALLNANRAIVTDIPGTTRDLITERADIRGLSIALIDTAGLRDSEDQIEREGIARARRVTDVADLLLVVFDQSRKLSDEDQRIFADTAKRRRVIVLNKADLPKVLEITSPSVNGETVVEISASTGTGLETLAATLESALAGDVARRDQPRVTNIRHTQLLGAARAALERAAESVADSGGAVSEEFLLADLQEAAALLQEITGKRSTDDLLRHIFERFCIGK